MTGKAMFRKAESLDIDFLDYTFTHPSIYPCFADDGCPQRFEMSLVRMFDNPLLSFYVALVDDLRAGVFLFIRNNFICLEVHALILPEYRGEPAVAICRAGIDHMFTRTECRKVFAQVPTYNVQAYALARRAGMQIEGVNTKSFIKNNILYDQYIMGIAKEGR